MPDVQPLRALHYNLDSVGELDAVVAPPYDVIDADLRAELAARSPFNIVHIDLPEGPDRYKAAAATLNEWIAEGVLERDAEPAIWTLAQEFTGPDGIRRTRTGFFARVRLEEYGPGRIRPHERTHAAAKEDRLLLTRATHANLSPIFGLFDDPQRTAGEALAGVTATEPWASATDGDDTVHTLWRTTDPETVQALTATLAENEILIADGHHRYETALSYSREIGGEGNHNYVLACLVAMSDPGLVVFPTHRLVFGLEGDPSAAIEAAIAKDFESQAIDLAKLEEVGSPDFRGAPGTIGYVSGEGDPQLLTLRSRETIDRLLADHANAYRELDTAILESIFLRGALGMTAEQIDHKSSLAYVQEVGAAAARVTSADAQALFVVPPTPIERVQAVATAGETMPPKSTYFYPKLLTGMLLSPLA